MKKVTIACLTFLLLFLGFAPSVYATWFAVQYRAFENSSDDFYRIGIGEWGEDDFSGIDRIEIKLDGNDFQTINNPTLTAYYYIPNHYLGDCQWEFEDELRLNRYFALDYPYLENGHYEIALYQGDVEQYSAETDFDGYDPAVPFAQFDSQHSFFDPDGNLTLKYTVPRDITGWAYVRLFIVDMQPQDYPMLYMRSVEDCPGCFVVDADTLALLGDLDDLEFTLVVQTYDGDNRTYTPSMPLSPVPEPATMLLVGAGLLGIAAIRRKIQK